MSILPQILMNALIAGSLYGLIALGFNLIYGTVKFFDLAYGSVLILGGYMVYLFLRIAALPHALAILLALSICGLFGLLIYRLVYTHLKKRKASNMIYLVASLGIFTMLQAIIALFFTSQFHTLSSGLQPVVTIGSVVVTYVQVCTIVLLFLVAITLSLVLTYTRLGKAIRAVSDDGEVSEIVGINTQKIISWVFIFAGIIGGLAGIMSSYDTGIEPTMGFSLLLKGVIAAIIGGIGKVWAGVVGALVLGLIENIGIWQLSAEWKDVIAFSVLIIFLLFRPRGMFQK